MSHEYSSHMYGSQWEQLSFEPLKPLCNIVSQIQTTPPGFCSSSANEIEVPGWSFEFPRTTESTVMMFCQQASGDSFTNNSNSTNKFTTSSLHLVAESFLSSSADSHSSSEKYSEFIPSSYSEKHSNFQPGSNMPFCEHFPQEHDKLLRDDAATDERPLEISFQRNQLASFTKPEKQCPQPCGVTSSNSASRRTASGKRRIRWTKDLHESFMMIVNRLGGPDRAKPKAILEMMKSDLLSISHVKSHLQKCRTTIYRHKAWQESSEEGHKTDDGVAALQVKINMQIEESRQLQQEVRRSIHQQLEMQRNLQVLIGQQREQLKMLLDQQKERTKLEKSP